MIIRPPAHLTPAFAPDGADTSAGGSEGGDDPFDGAEEELFTQPGQEDFDNRQRQAPQAPDHLRENAEPYDPGTDNPAANDPGPAPSEQTPPSPQGPASESSSTNDSDAPSNPEDEPISDTSDNEETPRDSETGDSDAPSEESGADSESDATSEASEDDAETDGEPFFEGEMSTYNTVDEAKKGIEEKDRYIDRLRGELNNVQEQSSKEVERLRSEVERQSSQIEALRSASDPQAVEMAEIQDYLDEEYRGKRPEDFSEDEDALLDFQAAVRDAKVQRRADRKKQQREQKRMQNEQFERQKEASQFVESYIEPKEFGATSPEREDALKQKLTAKEDPVTDAYDPYSPTEQAAFIAASFGEKAAERFLSGLKAEFQREQGIQTRPQPSPNTPDTETPSTDEVTEEIEKTQTQTPKPTQPPVQEENDMDARDELASIYGQSTPSGVRGR